MKILVISHNSFSQTHNNGKTLSAIFSCFSKNELCQLFFTPIGSPDPKRCDQYYSITNKDAVFSIIKRGKCGDEIKDYENKVVAGSVRPVRHTFFTQAIRDTVWFMSSWYHGGLKKWLLKQKPDAVFFVGGDAIFSHRIAVMISKKLDIPLITYFTDDYIVNAPRGVYRSLLSRYYLKTVNHSKLLYAIGEEMAKVYSAFFKKQFFPIMNIVEIINEPKVFLLEGNILTINYFGGVHLGRDREIARFGRYVRHYLRDYLNKDVDINVYTFGQLSGDIEKEFQELLIHVHSGLTGNDLYEAMLKTDIFLHVESILPQYKMLTSLSVSTKIPEYMSLNKPIIAYGPSDIASFKIIAKANDKLVVNDSGVFRPEDSTIRTIAGILNDTAALKKIASDNYHYALVNFNKEVVAKNFRGQIEKALKG